MIKEFHTHSVEETEQIGKDLALTLDKSEPSFIAMYGDLGVGKTAFVRHDGERYLCEIHDMQ